MFYEKTVPESARDTYRRDAWTGLLGGMYGGIIGPFVAFIARKELHSSALELGLMSAAPFIGSLLTIFYANSMEGRRKMPFVVWPLVAGRALFLLVVFINSSLPFALVVTGASILVSIIGPPYAAIMKEVYPDKQRGTIMSYIRVGLAFMTFVFTLIAGKLLPIIGYNLLLPLGAVLGIASAFIFGTIKTAPIDHDDPVNHRMPTRVFLRESMRILKCDGNNRWLAIAVSVAGFGNLVLMPLYPIYQVDRLHIRAFELALLTNVSTVAWMVSYPYWGKYVDVRSPVKAWTVAAFLSAVTPLNYFFATTWWHLFPGTVLGGLALGGIELGFFNAVLRYSRDGRETQHQAVHAFVQGLRGIVGPFVGAGMIVLFHANGWDIRYSFLLGAAMWAAGALLMLRWEKKGERAEVQALTQNGPTE